MDPEKLNQILKKERLKEETFGDELLTAREDIGERLKKGLEVFDGCVRRNVRDGYGSATELHAEAYRGGSASVTAGDTAVHFLRFSW